MHCDMCNYYNHCTKYNASGGKPININIHTLIHPHTPLHITLYQRINTGLKQTWEIGRFSMITRRYMGKLEEKITTEYEKLLSLLCFVNEFPKTKRRKYPQYTSE